MCIRKLESFSNIEIMNFLDEFSRRTPGSDFSSYLFNALQPICELCGFDYCCVGLRIPPKTNKVQTLIYIDNGQLESNFIYEVDDGACRTVIDTEQPYLCGDNVRAHYPDSPFLKAKNIQAFVGFPIKINNRLFGLCDFFSRTTISEDKLSFYKGFLQLVINQLSTQFELFIQNHHLKRITDHVLKHSLLSVEPEYIGLDDYLEQLSSTQNELFTSLINDLSDKKNIELAATESLPHVIEPSTLLNNILNIVPLPLYWKDLNGVYQGANQRFLLDVGFASQNELIGSTDKNMPWSMIAEQMADDDLQLTDSAEPILHKEVFFVDDFAVGKWLLFNKSVLKNEHGQQLGIFGTYMDITPQKLLEEKISLASITDCLTGLTNRKEFSRLIKNEMARVERDKTNITFSLMMFDIDRFKQINDQFGHHVGDHVLIELSSILQEQKRDVDCVARWGGDEFVVLLTNTDRDNAYEVAERYRTVIEQHDFKTENVTISIGVVGFVHGDSEQDLFQQVDAAMYLAKKNGRNCTFSG